ncbi:MAG: DPP IV N-terminal domain-containing protein [Armatimonadota bacterium]|nr:DPP IV N-terminal domain-containing protein [Armatimonadota bacterium]
MKTISLAGGASLLGPVAIRAEGGKPMARSAKPLKKAGGGASSGTINAYHPSREEVAENFERLDRYDALTRQPVYKMRLTPHWFSNNTRFWYRNDLARGAREFVTVDAAQGKRAPSFDHAKLAAALSQASGTNYSGDKLPFDDITYTPDGNTVQFQFNGTAWQCDLATYACTKIPHLAQADGEAGQEDRPIPAEDSQEETHGVASPDGQWTAFTKDNNLYVRANSTKAETALSQGGTADRPFGEARWSPDSKTLVGYRITPVVDKDVYFVESSPKDGGTRGILHSHPYPQAGDPFPTFEMWLFDPASVHALQAKVDILDFGDGPPDLHWSWDNRHVLYEKTDRGHQRFRLISVDTQTGQARNVIDEQTKTFINTSNGYTYYTKGAAEVIYVSERDGWRHLYLYDAENARLKNQITQGDWVVRDVERVDEDTRQIWFAASGKNPAQDPYLLHHYRINFDGTGLTALTDGDGSHSVQYSPDRKFLVDTYSRVNLPPVHELRRVSDGNLVCLLEKADISALTQKGWQPPEVFRAKGRDGKTDIWGVVCRPLQFDPSKKYPIIENIYAGPQDSFVRKTFAVSESMQSLAQLGFIVIQCDGMGTRNRSKAFHDVCWRNLRDAGLPDRIAWMRSLEQKYAYCDTGRVGIYGTSAGGQSSTGALLFYPDFYKVGVSSCGCHDNRIDKRWWNEQWMGYPVGPWYADSSNIVHASNLRGHLFLMVGEMDTNVPPESTLRLADALIKSNKDFDLLVLPGSDHTSGGAYGERRRRDFFIQHLLGAETPDRNVPVTAVMLKPLPLSEESSVQPGGGDDTTIKFVNLTRKEIELFWLSGDGTRKSYATVPAGQSYTQNTHSGHYWLVTAKGGPPLALFVGESRPGIAEIRVKAK